MVALGGEAGWGGAGEGAFSGLEVGVEVDLGGFGGFVAEPEGDDAAVDAALEEGHGGGVPERVWGDVFVLEGGASGVGCGGVLGDEAFDGVAAEVAAAVVGEDGRVGGGWAFVQPGFEDARDVAAEGGGAELAAFAVAADVGAVVEGEVLALEADEFGDAQSGLDGGEEERAVASAMPGGGVGAGEQ